MKKTLAATLAFILLFTLLFCSTPVSGILAFAEEIVNPEFVIDENGVLTKYNGTADEVVIPGNVTRIAQYAFYLNSHIKKITVPGNVKSIARNSISLLNSLQYIIFEEGVETIEAMAISSCHNLLDISVSSSIIFIGEDNLSSCDRLLNIEVSLYNLNYSSLDGVLFNKDKTSLLRFPQAKSATLYSVPQSVVNIEKASFSGCTQIEKIILGENVLSIGDSAFGHASIQEIELNERLKTIGSHAFSNCKSLQNIIIPSCVESIEQYTFSECSKLQSVTIRGQIPQLHEYTFNKCTSLREVYLPSTITVIGENAFYECNSLNSISLPSDLLSIEENAFWCCGALTSITIPGEVTKIGDAAFFNCNGLESIVISNSVEQIGKAAFGYCEKLNNIVIPGSVKVISDGAFKSCTGLTDITILYGLETIGSNAFEYCARMKTASLPNSVTTIGRFAFSNCTSLKSITIPASVSKIDYAPFTGCTSMTSIDVSSNNSYFSNYEGVLFSNDKSKLVEYPCGKADITFKIPGSVQTIEPYAFSGSKIQSINIPSQVEKIEGEAFSYCGYLRTAILEEGVKEISYNAFMKCENLTSVIIPRSVNKIAYGTSVFWDTNAFLSCNNTTIYCYSDSYTADVIPYLKVSCRYMDVTTGAYHLQVLGKETQKPIENAMVELKDSETGAVMFSGQTDGAGQIEVPNLNGFQWVVCVTADSFLDYEMDITAIDGARDIVFLSPDLYPDQPYLVSAAVDFGNHKKDILTKTYTVTAGSGSPVVANINLKANWRDKIPLGYKIMDNSNHELRSETGIFSQVNIGETFDQGEKIFAVVIYKDSLSDTAVREARIPLNLKVYSDSNITFLPGMDGSEAGTIDVGKALGFSLPGNIPLLGGTQIHSSISFLPIQVNWDQANNKVKVVIGVDQDDIDFTGNYNPNGKYDKWKSEIDKAMNAMDKDNLRSPLTHPKTGKMGLVGDTDQSISFAGYMEFDVKDGNLYLTSGGMYSELGLKWEFSKPFVIGAVPCYAEFIFEITAKLNSTITEYTGGSIQPPALTIAPKITVGAGLGVPHIARVGGRGSLELEMLSDYVNSHDRVSLNGTLSIFGEIAIFSAEIPLLNGTWVIYDNYANGANTLRSSSVMPKMALSLYDSSEYSISSRDYGDKPGQWLGGGARLRSLALRSGTPDVSRQETLLQTSVYSGAEPMIGEYGGKRFLLWTADSASRGAADRTMLSYSVYNPLTGGWSAPQALQDDGTADSFPQFAGGDDLFVVWQDNNTRFGDTAELNAWAASSEIKVAKAAGADFLGSAEITTLTSNASADFMPKIAAEGNEAAVVWLGNSENDMLGVSGANSVFLSTYNGSEWSAPQQIFETQNPVMNLDVGFVNGDVSVVLDVDTDGDAYTLEDREIFLKKGSAGFERLTHNETLDSGAQFAEIGGETALFWYADGNIAYRTFSENGGLHTVFAEQKADLSDTFEIITNGENTALTWSKEMDETAEVFASMYNSETGEWSRETAVTAAGASLRNTHGVFDDSGNLMIAANRKTPQESGGFQNDLVVYFVPPKPDAEAIDYYYEQADVQAGAQLPVTVGVGNEGQQPIEEVTVTIADPSGEILVADTEECSILPGETADVTCLLPLPEAICLTEYTVTVTTPGDGNARNDFLTMKVGYTDLCLSVEEYDTETARYADLMITNLTDVPTGATLTIRENSKDGPVVYEQEFETIDKSTNGSYLFRIDKTTLEYEADGTKTYYYSVSSTVEEYSGADNTALTVVSSDDAYELQKNLPVTGVVLSAAALQMVPTDTAKINAAVLPYNAADKTLTWSSSNESVAVVDENGLVTAKAAGTASITAAAGEKSASCLITVSEGEPHSITLSTEGRGTALCPEEALPGSKVSIELRPEEGARLNRQAILCTGISAEDITAGGSTLTFTMPNHAVSLTLPFEEYEYAVFRDGSWKNGGLTAGSTAQIADGRLCGDGISLETGSVPENLRYLVLRAKAQPLEKPEISLDGRTCAIASLEQYGRTLEGFDKTLVLDTGGFTGGTLFLNAAGLEIEELYFASEKPEIPYAEGELAGVTISEEEAYQNLPVTFQVLSPVAYNRIKAVDDEGNLLKYEDGYTLLENGMYLYEFSIPFAEAGEKTIRFHGRLTQDSMYFSDIGETVYLNVLPHAGIRRVEQVGTDYDGKILIEVETQAGLFNRVKLTDENNVLLGHTGLFTPGESDTDIWTIAIDAPAGTKITAQGRYGSYYTRETKSIVLHAPDPIPQSDLLSVEQGSIDESGQVTITVITTAGVYNRVKLLSESGELLGHTGISSPGREEGTEVWVITISAQAGDTVVAKGRIDSTYTREALSYTIV